MKKLSVVVIICLSFIFSFSALAQTKSKKTTAKTKPTVKTTAIPTPTTIVETPEPTPQTTPPVKKNERPEDQTSTPQNEPKKKNQTERNSTSSKPEQIKYPYIYEFSQPNFVVSHIVIQHDEKGKGTITFEKRDSADEPITDPLQLTQFTLDKINKLFETLNFLNSTENYQSPTRDYGHLGNYTITLRKDSLERTAKYNWSENKDAKALADEYRKVAEQFIWYFDMNISRENQPLEAPSLVDRLESMVKRDEVSDASQMLPYLKDLSNDERIPLIARNHVTRIIKDIEKKKP
ncbi:MAG TPA: hypothetical protein PKY82_27835 [Pyrinomonadaceae bacterium]|nr:hypothetical protein [Pyrinomonadaceae bacterium]